MEPRLLLLNGQPRPFTAEELAQSSEFSSRFNPLLQEAATAPTLTRAGQLWYDGDNLHVAVTDGGGNLAWLDLGLTIDAEALALSPAFAPTWTNVTYQNSWVTASLANGPVQYRKIGDRVELRGAATGGAAESGLANLPVGFRPAHIKRFMTLAIVADAPVVGYLVVFADGWIVPYTGTGGSMFSLDGITFDVSAA